ncbi:MAG TPA: tRNA threonylcarbamoyladenosine dehydratase [Candidatus Merdisoma faecalis]|nr:tRNA threonylcarbamoyladenosine dehydratase [Candidatus Merdisoma faecalis]
MTAEQFSRTELLLGEEAMEILKNARVAVFGIGGVGGYVTEALARSGVGAFDLTDKDRVCLSNLNRQIIATHKSIGKYKTEVMRERILDINPEAEVRTHECFYLPETKGEFDFSSYSYVVDAVDTVTAKLSLAEEAKAAGVPMISSMGAGNKLNPFLFETADIYETSVCPLARVMRRELRKRGIDHLKVVYSKEAPLRPLREADGPGSTAFVPSVAGLLIASEVIRDLTESAVRRAREGQE